MFVWPVIEEQTSGTHDGQTVNDTFNWMTLAPMSWSMTKWALPRKLQAEYF